MVPSVWAKMFRFYPPFNFAKAFADISNIQIYFSLLSLLLGSKASPVFNYQTGYYQSGPGMLLTSILLCLLIALLISGYSWKDMYNSVHVSMLDFDAPATIYSFYYLMMNAVIFAGLAWFVKLITIELSGSILGTWIILLTHQDLLGFFFFHHITTLPSTNQTKKRLTIWLTQILISTLKSNKRKKEH